MDLFAIVAITGKRVKRMWLILQNLFEIDTDLSQVLSWV